jgi:hypothetical protein
MKVIPMNKRLFEETNQFIRQIVSDSKSEKEFQRFHKRLDKIIERGQKLVIPSHEDDVETITLLMKKNYSLKDLKSDKFYQAMLNFKFNNSDDKLTVFNAWFRINVTKDIFNALFLEVDDEHGHLYDLERSIANGKRHNFPFEDFIETDKGLTHKMFL